MAIFNLANSIVLAFFLLLLTASVILYLFFYEAVVYLGLRQTLFYIPFMVMFLGSYQPLYYLFNRYKKYKALSYSRVQQNLVTAILNIVLGIFSLQTIGLVISRIAGQFFSVIYLFKGVLKMDNSFKWEEIKEVAKSYVRFPKFFVAAQLTNTFSLQLPVLLISAMFGSFILGLFALTQRVVLAPIAIIATSIGDVFRQQASVDFAEHGNCRPLYIKTFKKLLFISLLPFAVFYFIAPWLFSFVFGKEWYVAGVYAQLLTPMFFAQFIGKPLSSIFLVTEKQNLELIWQFFFLIFTILPFALKYIVEIDIMEILMCFSALRFLSYTVLIVWGYRISYLKSKT
jgi:O-antigen/teichoic acid export membrane protein